MAAVDQQTVQWRDCWKMQRQVVGWLSGRAGRPHGSSLAEPIPSGIGEAGWVADRLSDAGAETPRRGSADRAVHAGGVMVAEEQEEPQQELARGDACPAEPNAMEVDVGWEVCVLRCV